MAAAVSYRQIAWTFLRLGATVALLERRGLTPRSEVADALTYTKLLPGSTVVQIVSYLGWRLRRWPGSALATVCFILPSALLMLLLAYGYAHVAHLPAIVAVRRGVIAAVVALLLVTMHGLAKSILTTRLSVGLALAAFLLGFIVP